MLRIKKNPQKKPAQDVTFDNPQSNQRNGIEMLIMLNTTPRSVITGPEVDIDSKILVSKQKPNFFFNPVILDSNDLNSELQDSTLYVSYMNYQGEAIQAELQDTDGEFRKAVEYLNNGKASTRTTTKKV